jgi:hypoxanthine-guanine phosphoribosyltransferase
MLEHDCAGLDVTGDYVMACKCLSADMYIKIMRYARQEFIKEIQAFAGEYHHHIEGRDVVIVEQLINFLQPIEGKVEDGLGTT